MKSAPSLLNQPLPSVPEYGTTQREKNFATGKKTPRKFTDNDVCSTMFWRFFLIF